MSDTTRTHETGRGFPSTRYSLLTEVRSSDAAVRDRALDVLVSIYWRPVYKYLRLKWNLSIEDAEDLTQEFFASALARDVFAAYDPAKARFRTFLRLCVDRFAANERRAETRLKRRGSVAHVSLDFENAESELHLASDAADPDEFFRREWVRSMFGLAVDELRRRSLEAGKQTQFAIFERYDLEDDDKPTYQALAVEYGVPATQVTNYLAAMRREFRGLVLARLREASASHEEFRADARELLGVDPG